MTTAVRTHASLLKVAVNGRPLVDDVEPLLVGAWIDETLHQPATFLLEFRDRDRDVIQRGGFEIGATVVLRVVTENDQAGQTLISGEATAFEAEFDVTGSRLYVRGYDRSHRLRNGTRTVIYRNVTASDVVRQVAQRAGLAVGTVDNTKVVYDQLTQSNSDDWRFLASLASREHRVLSVTDGALCFATPGTASGGPGPAPEDNPSPRQLSPLNNLLRLRVGVTAAEQVGDVQVRGWDYHRKQTVVGHAPAECPAVAIGTAPAGIGSPFGSRSMTGVHNPYSSQAEADQGAASLAGAVASTFASLEGVALGSPLLRAGIAVSINGMGQPFDGTWVLTSTRHRFTTDDGYTVAFRVSGPDRALLGRTADPSGVASPGTGLVEAGRFYGVAVGQVTNVNDPDNLARVRVRLPWLADDHESDWARLIQAGAGKQRGMVVLPEVDDEVLVAFEHGDLEHPVVLGPLYNGVDQPPLGSSLIDASDGSVNRRGFVSKSGGALVFLDGQSSKGVALLSGDRGLRISLNQSATTIKITSEGKVEISGSDQVTIKAGSSLSLEAQTSMTLKAGTSLELHGSQVKVSGDGPVQVQGSPIQLN